MVSPRKAYMVAGLFCVLAIALAILPQLLSSSTPSELWLHGLPITMAANSGQGEWIEVRLSLSSTYRPGHSYAVNGTGEYDNVELKCFIHVEFSNVENVVINYIKIKAVDGVDGSYYEYTLAGNVAVSSSPYDNTFTTGQMTIDAHLNDIQADPDPNQAEEIYHVKYYVAAQVSGSGAISGDTLTTTIDYEWFNTYDYGYLSSPSSDGFGWTSWAITLIPAASLTGLAILACLAFWWARRVMRVQRGGRGARA